MRLGDFRHENLKEIENFQSHSKIYRKLYEYNSKIWDNMINWISYISNITIDFDELKNEELKYTE